MRYGRKRPSAAAAQREADAWNARYPVGTPVRYWPWLREGDGREGQTCSEAVVMCDHASVWVTGYASSVSLSHVEPAQETANAR